MMQGLFHITFGFREVFAKQKFGWSLQGGISKSLLCVFSARKKAEGSVQKIFFVFIH